MNEHTTNVEHLLPGERTRLVRLCARLTGDVDVAEDLAQETLMEAWRHAHKLYDPQGYTPWLSAIARNVCLRWRQRRSRELSHLTSPDVHQDGLASDPLQTHPANFDLEVELERDELATLLDRALALLPSHTRTVLIERYIEETPLAEVATRLGMSDSAVKARLHRGKLMLRRVLLEDFPAEAATYGLNAYDTTEGQETRIWCSQCGQARLLGIFDHENGELSLNCPHCSPGVQNGYSWLQLPNVFQGVKGYRAALSRQQAWVHEYFQQAFAYQSVACIYCGGPTTPHLGPPAEGPMALHQHHGAHLRCTVCHTPIWTSLGGLALNTLEGRRFLRRYVRIHALPAREVEHAGMPAFVKSYTELHGSGRLDVIFARDNLQILGAHGAPVAEQE